MNSLKITFCGDFVSFSPNDIRVDDEIISILSQSDLNYVNVEAPISDGGDRPIYKSGPSLCQSSGVSDIIKKLGFNIVSLANNHIFDFGEIAARRTAASFSDIKVVGLGLAEDVYQVTVIACKGLKIGVLSACQREFGAIDSDEERYGYAWINDDRLDKAIMDARPKCDFLFVCPHAGIEEVVIPLPEWRKRYRSLIELGADAVIASHPHIVQGYEEYKGKRIYYSLGNFFFDRPAMKDCWHYGLMVTITIERDEILYENRFVKLEGSRLILDSERLHEMDHLNSLLVGKEYERQIETLVEDSFPFYDDYYAISNSSPLGQHGFRKMLSWARRAMKGYRDDLLLVNMVRCESHRWLYVRCLNKRCKNNY